MTQQLFKKYVVKRQLRSVGGYMTVFLAGQAGLERDVELRLLNRPVAHDTREFKQFRREFRSLARLDHPNIARVLDVGYTKTRIFYTTDYRNAVSLEDLLQRIGGPMTRLEILEVAASIGDALAHIHEKQLLHRNITTGTVFFDLDNQRPYVAEFSLVKDLEATSFPAGALVKSSASALIPTPEALEGTPFDALTDLFLFGAMLYRLATFADPFPVPSGPQSLSPRELFRITPPSSVNVNLSKRLEELILKLLEPERGKRFQSAREFLKALAGLRPAMDAESLINRERKDILQGIRQTMRMDSPDSGTRDRPTAGTAPPQRRGFPGATSILMEGKSLIRQLKARKDGFGGLAAGLFLLAAVGALGLAWWSSSMASGAGDAPPLPAPAAEAPPSPARRAELEDEILRITATLKYKQIGEEIFLDRWKLLKAYVMALPEERQAAVLPYSRLLAIKLRFLRDPVGAGEELVEAYRACERAIKGS